MSLQDNSKTQNPTEVFERALRGLSKVGTPFLSEEETSSELSEASAQPDGFRDGLMKSIIEDNPGLTYEKLDQQMKAFGF